ncbi:hypothetical protein ACFOVU_27105 [Nocardiopsis sediminis]|uniref:Uncharacterized protein n=1 Tax=Nocardiopsis sediminis TaxID=1778267 RepID=A0ABV8FXX1_9ACTN
MTAQPTPPDGAGGSGERRAPYWVMLLLRGTLIVATLQILAQAVLAGAFSTGDVRMLIVHANNGDFLTVVQLLTVIASVGLWWRGRGPAWPILLSVVLLVATEVQKYFGYVKNVLVHIPLGVLLFGATLVLLIWALAPLRVRPRARGRKKRDRAAAEPGGRR